MYIYMEGSIKEKLKNSRANEGFTSRFFRDTNAVAETNMLKDFCIYCTKYFWRISLLILETLKGGDKNAVQRAKI